MRLEPQEGEAIDRSAPVAFTFDGKPVSGFAGDTIGSALYAAGRRVFSRSFKVHRPRGLLCCSGHCANCMVTVDGVPSVRSCVEPLRAGADVRGQNVRGSVDRDLLSIVDRFGGPFTPVGFYYRTMIRPRRLWPVYERFLRSVAGLGRVGGAKHLRRDTEHRRVDVLVVGGGESGRAAAEQAAAAGERTLLVDERGGFEPHGYELLAPARALGAYEGGLVPVDAGDVLYRVRAARLVVATGALEQPLVFPGNDLVGVVLPNAVRRLANEWAIKPGERAVIVSADENGLGVAEDLRRAGTEVIRVVDLREERPQRIEATGKNGRLARVTIDSEAIDCDLLVVSGGRQPAYALLAQAGARIEYDPGRGIFVPTELPPGVEVVGSAAGEIDDAAVPRASYDGHGKCVVCLCEDVTTKDVTRAVAEGFDSIELAKRYTTATMGPCQGKLCHLASIRLLAQATGTDESAIGTTTARPPWAPVELGLLAGRHYEPCKRTPLHARHEQAGAEMIWTGQWRRAFSYGDPAAEVRAVHTSLGVIDVSTLGKLVVEGPDAATFLERLYPNRFADLKVGRVRYGVLTTDGGRITDDGTIARLADDLFYVTTTSTGSESVFEWFEWWNAVWGYHVEIANLTGGLAAVNLAGPHAREALAALTSADVSNDAFRYLDARELEVAGVPCLAMRIGFVGELGYELHCAASAGEHLWDALVAGGAVPFGLEPQRVLRLEKGHVIVGQDTDSESNLLSAGMPWIVKADKDDFVGKWAVEHVRERGVRERLVGFVMDDGAVPPEGAQVVRDGRPAGRVTSSRVSEQVGRAIGLAWVDPDQAEEGTAITIHVAGAPQTATVTLAPFYDPEGERLRA
ncbi:MAG TPA: 2Fe-2S iron-sulfur cluster-binding protein [Gaiellaceae bacterium]|nr:2Fe-2S iron-sulfur cluster-binding protein [Gaiellaceae bacterium]